MFLQPSKNFPIRFLLRRKRRWKATLLGRQTLIPKETGPQTSTNPENQDQKVFKAARMTKITLCDQNPKRCKTKTASPGILERAGRDF